MPNLSIVIPSCGPVVGLWATIASCIDAAEKFDYEIVVVVNGTALTPEHLRLSTDRVRFMHVTRAIGPAAARELGAVNSTGEWIFFVDDHCVVPKDTFNKVMGVGSVVFCPAKSLFDGPTFYHYLIESKILETMDARISEKPRLDYPYLCLSAQAGQFLVKRSVWEKMEGYNGLFDGYCGEEVFFGMKAWMHDIQCYMHPKAVVWHHSRFAEYKKHDEAYKERFVAGLTFLRNLKAVHSLENAYERARMVCPE